MAALSPADVGDGRNNGDPRTFLLNGQWVDPRTYSGAGMGGVTYAGPADSAGYIAGQAPAGGTNPMYMYGDPRGEMMTTQPVPGGGPVGGGGFGQSPMLPGYQQGGAGPAGQMAAGSQNPWLQQMGSNLAGEATNAFQRNVLPAIASQQMAAGGYGSSRHGVVEANAMNDLGRNITTGLGQLYGQGYGQGLQYDLGVRNNELGYAGLDRQINNDNLGWQMQGVQLGLNANQALQQGNAAGLGAGNAIQQTPMDYWKNFANQANSFGQGFSSQTQSGGGQSNPLVGALGGMQLGTQLGNLWGQNNAPTTGGGGFGTGANYGNQDYGSYF